MELVVLILNKTECLEKLLKRFREEGIQGATIVDSKGMAHSLCEYDELRLLASLRMVLDPDHKESKTIFAVIREEQVPLISRLVNEVTGGLNHPDTGVLFTVPVRYMEGFGD